MSDGPEKLEQLIDGLVRTQPLRRAPASLEARVFAQIAAQARLAWWRRGFIHWPVTARAAFSIASFGFVGVAVVGFMLLTSWVHAREFAGVATLRRAGELFESIAAVTGAVLNAFPSAWLYGAAAVGFVLYAVLFGLGTVAYRTLYVQR
jgi:hypothetical protein